MFDVGFWEILLILVLALVVIGPERLPGAARQAGFWVGKARRYIEGVRTEVEQELDVNEFKRMLHNQEVQINELQQQIKSSVDDVGSEISKDIPSSDFLSDVPSHTLQDEKPDEPADPDEVKKSSKTDEEKS
ncbi:Sec-independent protein translocase protein TatB [bacterium]|jgi:sec-independent protein translocase protein TatB|nr:Sec-independent protein translocase protein TatB [bacterium]